MIEMRFVDSTSVVKIGYDPGAGELHVVYRSSPTRYVYHHVPGEVHARLMASPSKGAFINAEIKPVYAFHVA